MKTDVTFAILHVTNFQHAAFKKIKDPHKYLK